MYDELFKELEERNMAGNFHFAGLVPPGEVASYIAQADILWHLSLHEGLPRAVVQALAVGIPAIGFHLDGTPEVVLNGITGFTTAPEDVCDTAEKTVLLLNEPELRRKLGANGKQKVLQQFDWHRMSDILEEEYSLLLAAKKH